jgi:hypothetical protein
VLSGVEDIVPRPTSQAPWKQYSNYVEFQSGQGIDRLHLKNHHNDKDDPLLIITNIFDYEFLHLLEVLAQNDPRYVISSILIFAFFRFSLFLGGS